MPEGMLTVVAFLSLGYLLFAVEMVVPGGVLGILGVVSVLYGCWQAFQMGFVWGSGSILLSLVFFVLIVRFFLHSRTGKQLTLSNDAEARSWKSGNEGWQQLVGQEGTATSPLRPAGVADIGGVRYDVVSDSEFLDVGCPIRVVKVEGRRILVEPATVPSPNSLDEAGTSGSRSTTPETPRLEST